MVISRNRSLGVQLDYSLEYLRTVICKIYEKQFLRNVLSIFIEQIPLSLVSAGAYGTGKCLNGQHKSNIFFSAQVDDSHIGLLIPFFTRANVRCKGKRGDSHPFTWLSPQLHNGRIISQIQVTASGTSILGETNFY